MTKALAEGHCPRDAGLAAIELGHWPCSPGIEPLPSERGYDYLGENLAGHGFVMVSVRANGINGGSQVSSSGHWPPVTSEPTSSVSR